jgi:hypothetical protein
MGAPINFLDLKTKQIFVSSNYGTEINAKGMLMAVTVAPSGTLSKRLIKKYET